MPGSDVEINLSHISNDVKGIRQDFDLMRDKVIPKLARHDIVLYILGAAILVSFPVAVTWQYKLQDKISNLTRSTIILQERFRHYDRTHPPSSTFFFEGNNRYVTGEEYSNCILPGVTLEGQHLKPVLYSGGEIHLPLVF